MGRCRLHGLCGRPVAWTSSWAAVRPGLGSRGRCPVVVFFFFSSRRRHTRYWRDWSSDVCSSDLTGRGIAARQIDHITVASLDVMKDTHWYCETLGFRFMEYSAPDEYPDLIVFAQTTTNEKSHDFGFVADFSGVPGRINHFALFVPETKDLLRAADILLVAGIPIAYGPGEHGMGEQEYLYFREPGGMRVEINSGGYRNYVPDWEPVKWVASQGSNTMYRNTAMPDSMTESFPRAGQSFPEPAAMAKPGVVNFFGQPGRG